MFSAYKKAIVVVIVFCILDIYAMVPVNNVRDVVHNAAVGYQVPLELVEKIIGTGQLEMQKAVDGKEISLQQISSNIAMKLDYLEIFANDWEIDLESVVKLVERGYSLNARSELPRKVRTSLLEGF